MLRSLLPALMLTVCACTSSVGEPTCAAGTQACSCTAAGACGSGLACVSGVCERAGDDPDDDEPLTDAGDSRDASAADGSAAGCGDTLTDPRNCGACGRQCAAGTGVCAEGACQPAYSPCVSESSGFTNCERVCESLGTRCSEDGCSGGSIHGWGLDKLAACESGDYGVGRDYNWSCSEILWTAPEQGHVRCCCAGD